MMSVLLAFILAATPAPTSTLPPGTIVGPDPRQGPMAVSDKFLLPGRVPECANREEVQRAAEDKIKGWPEECLPPIEYERKTR